MSADLQQVDVPKPKRQRAQRPAIEPRGLFISEAAAYLGCSDDAIYRLINAGELPVVKLPVERHSRTGLGIRGRSDRNIIDRNDLDALIERSKERRG